ncbi:MAG: ribosome maturation factor RimP [Candidatus Bathyarchaeota archaeon]
MSEAKRIIEEVSLLVESLLAGFGMELVDVEFRFENGRWILRIFIDKKGGVTVGDCANVSRELGDLIEAEDIIAYHYVLEVSSPGLNRPLKKESDFVGSIGRIVMLKMSRPINNRRSFVGRLSNVSEGMIRLFVDDNSVELPLKDVEKARLKYEFN